MFFNSINSKLLLRHGPSAGDARRGWLPETEPALQPQHRLKALRAFQTKQPAKLEKRGEREKKEKNWSRRKILHSIRNSLKLLKPCLEK